MSQRLAVWQTPWHALVWLVLAGGWGALFAASGGVVHAALALGVGGVGVAQAWRARRGPLVVVDADGFTYRNRRFAFRDLESCFSAGGAIHVFPVSGVAEQLSLLGVPRAQRARPAEAMRSRGEDR